MTTTTLEQVHREGRLIRGSWATVDERERQLLCLYTALVGDPDARPVSCPASLCPLWLAHLLPWIDDAGSVEHWPAVVERVVRLAPRFASLPPELEWTVCALCVREAMRHTTDTKVLAVCERVAELCERRSRGEAVSWKEMAISAEAASTEAAASWAGAPTGPPATWVAMRAAELAAETASAKAESVWTAATAAVKTAWEAKIEAKEKAADRMIDTILDAIESASK